MFHKHIYNVITQDIEFYNKYLFNDTKLNFSTVTIRNYQEPLLRWITE